MVLVTDPISNRESGPPRTSGQNSRVALIDGCDSYNDTFAIKLVAQRFSERARFVPSPIHSNHQRQPEAAPAPFLSLLQHRF